MRANDIRTWIRSPVHRRPSVKAAQFNRSVINKPIMITGYSSPDTGNAVPAIRLGGTVKKKFLVLIALAVAITSLRHRSEPRTTPSSFYTRREGKRPPPPRSRRPSPPCPQLCGHAGCRGYAGHRDPAAERPGSSRRAYGRQCAIRHRCANRNCRDRRPTIGSALDKATRPEEPPAPAAPVQKHFVELSLGTAAPASTRNCSASGPPGPSGYSLFQTTAGQCGRVE